MRSMSRAQPLPPPLGDGAFRIAEARELGVSRSRMRASDLVAPTRGVRVLRRPSDAVDVASETPSQRMERVQGDLRRRAEEFAPALTPDQFYSGATGLALLGAPIPYTTADQLELHVAARHPAGKPRRAGVSGHRLGARPPDRWLVRGLPIEHPARLWRQAAEDWRLDDLIAAGDHLVLPRRRLVSLADLEDEAAASTLRSALLVQALAEIRIGAESPGETRLRLPLTRAGLPLPELNWNLSRDDGRFIARLDLAWPRYRVASEYDGRVHASDEQFARDADRWDEIRDVDWNLVRVLSHHVRPSPQVAVNRVSRALFDAGWRPGRD